MVRPVHRKRQFVVVDRVVGRATQRHLDAATQAAAPQLDVGARYAGLTSGAEPAGKPVSGQSIRIVNVLDPSVVGDYLATPSGEGAILNVIRRNRGAINA
jgi:hypothetical protein